MIVSVKIASANPDVTCNVSGTNFSAGLAVRIYSNGALIMTLSGTSQVSNLTADSFTLANLSLAAGDYSIQVKNSDGSTSNLFAFQVTAT